ncbi:uncharacterized protein DNG_05229 [Cephalotrichum gorgonifer]|uniref:Xylanolytic transcriptional activator regulatory domain-containing protein n=1 Tax=Cephalotrichum gorgonifer TaxID=2041049 RepID=A0AAE8MXH2_9PEZI|nr:uncharacterized protein DNG_05229 [Cephalotrichum gorgonifer]
MDNDNDPDSPDPPAVIPPFAVLSPGTAAPQTVPSTAPSNPTPPGAAPLNPPQLRHLPPPEAHPSRRENDLLERLRKLEGVVEELSGQVDSERHGSTTSTNSPDAPQQEGGGGGEERNTSGPGFMEGLGSGGAILIANEDATGVSGRSTGAQPAVSYEANASLYKQFGRLVINKGKGRYISSAFWSSVKDELDQVREGVNSLSDETDYSTDDEIAEKMRPVPSDTYSHDAFMFGHRSASLDLGPFHPPPAHILRLWEIYQDNVEPAIKMIHVPTIDAIFQNLASGTGTLKPQDEALVFTIYYAAIVSLENDETEAEFGSPKTPLLARYRFALEQGMAKTNMLTDLDFTVLTALVLFLTVVRRHDDSRFCWTTTGLAIRIAQGLGLHRDGTSFKLPPYEVEMRRRVWWSICSLDMRCAEETGTDLTIVNRTFDTEFPSNINDADISPDSTEMPPSRVGLTDTAVAIVRHETLALCRRLFALATAAGSVCPKDAASSMAERERMLVKVYERVESSFLRHLADAPTDSSISVMVAMVARIIMAKSSLIIYQPMLFPGAGSDLSAEIKERLFVSAVEVVEYVRRLNSDPRFKRWRWLFQTYTHWHAVVYILLEMSRRTWTPILERAWEDVDGSLKDEYLAQLTRTADHLAVWMPLRRLLLKARRHRAAEITRMRADPEEVRRIHRDDARQNKTRSCFGHVGGMEVDHDLVRERWLALVAPGGLVSRGSSDDSGLGFAPTTARQPPSQPQQQQVHRQVPGHLTLATDEMQAMEYIDDLLDDPLNFYRSTSTLQSDGGGAQVRGGSSSGTTAPSAPPSRTDPDESGPLPNPPPFLWTGGWGEVEKVVPGITTGVEGLLGAAMGSGLGPFGDEEDGSMNLDVDFSWEAWQESVREMSGRTPMGNSGWGF